MNIDYILQNHGIGGGSGTSKDKIPPPPVTSFTATSGNAQVTLNWTNPIDTDFVGIKILRKIGSYPTSPVDGVIVYSGANTSYVDTTPTNGTQYFYRAFTFDYDNNFNTTESGQEATATPLAVKEYGINWNKLTDTVTRLGNAIGLNAPNVNGNTNYTNDFSTLYPWKDMKRVNLSDSGVENAVYGDVAYKTDATNGQCMVRVPKFYYKVVNTDVNNIQFWIADAPKDGYEVHPAFLRCRDKLCDDQTGVAIEVDKRYHHTYLPSLNGTKLESKSGVSPLASVTIGNGRTYAKNRGNSWGLKDFNLNYAIQMLYLIEFAHFDSQTKIGRGFVDGNTASHKTGGTNNYGNNSYGEATGKLQMSYRGIEDFYGNCYQWLDGFFCNASRNILIGNKGFNDIGTGYITYTTGLGADFSGYISEIFGDKTTGFAPKVCSGSATTKLYDPGSLYAGCLPIAGGYWDNASYTGAFYFYCINSASNAIAYIACSLAF